MLLGDAEQELRQLLPVLRAVEPMARILAISDIQSDERFTMRGGMLRSFAIAWIPGWEGEDLGVVIAASTQPQTLSSSQWRHLGDLAKLTGNELELENQRANPRGIERRKTQEQLLEKTLELAKFGEDLRQIHRLTTTNYESLDDVFKDYLETGRSILGLCCGIVTQARGRYMAIRAVNCEGPSMSAGLTFESGQIFCGIVARELRTVACSCTEGDARFESRPHYGSSASYIGTPIIVEGELYGVLSFSSPHKRWRAFSSHETEIIELMAKGIGRAIYEGHMQAARQRAETLEKDRNRCLEMVAKDEPMPGVLDQVARMVERQSPSLAVAIHRVKEGKVYCLAAPSLPESFRRRNQEVRLEEGRNCVFSAAYTLKTEIFAIPCPPCQTQTAPSYFHDHCWQASAVCPILSGSGELLGLLTAYWKYAMQPREANQELLEMAGSLAAIAMERRQLMERLAYQAHFDSLTQLPNRTLLKSALEEKIQQAGAKGETFAVLFMDLDRFKQVNDHLGHAAGDAVLIASATRIQSILRDGEIAARIGGDEFVAILNPGLSHDSIRTRAQEILETLSAAIEVESHQAYVTASLGISLFPQGGNTAEALLGNADLAMYRVKKNGKNGLEYFEPGSETTHIEKIELQNHLRDAIDNQELQLRYQPIVDLDPGGGAVLSGFEALLAWEHSQLGKVPASVFIPVAEESGLIGRIGDWVMRQACLQLAEWHRRDYGPVRISVNVSALQFQQEGFVEFVKSTLEETGIEGSCLELELTESLIISDIDAATAKLRQLRALGVRTAMDDFGTGYSSLAYLRWIPVDVLKIDQAFLAEIDSSAAALTLVQTIVNLAHNMGLAVVAEGVERETQLELLRAMHCDKVQGHYFGHSLEVHIAEEWLAGEEALTC